MCVTCRQESRQTACEEAKCAAEQVLEAKAAVATARVVMISVCVCVCMCVLVTCRQGTDQSVYVRCRQGSRQTALKQR